MKEITLLVNRFNSFCYSKQDREDLQQTAYILYLEHKHLFNPNKGNIQQFINFVIYRKLLTYITSASVSNARKKEVLANIVDCNSEFNLDNYTQFKRVLTSMSLPQKRLLSKLLKKSKAPSKIRVSKQYVQSIKDLESYIYTQLK